MISRFIKRREKVVRIGGETFEPQPLDLEQAIELLLLLAPYVALIERYLPDLRNALENTKEERPRLLSALFTALSGEIEPQDFTKAFAILLQKPPEWFRGVRAAELVAALPVLDDVNDFVEMLSLTRELGLTVKYMPSQVAATEQAGEDNGTDQNHTA